MSKRRKPTRKPPRKSPRRQPHKPRPSGSDDAGTAHHPPEADPPKPAQPPVTSDCLVSAELLNSVTREFYQSKREEISQRVRVLEPALWRAVRDKKDEIMNAVGCFGSDEEKSDLMTSYMENTTLIIIETLRRAYYELWRGTVVGTRLERLAPMEPPPDPPNPTPGPDPDNY